MSPDFMKYCNELCVVGMYLVTRGGHGGEDGVATHSVSARALIAEMTGMPEDPATGSACGCFVGWALANHFHTGGGNQRHDNTTGTATSTFVVGQGYEMNRPSLLHVNVVTTNPHRDAYDNDDDDDDADGKPKILKVHVGGNVVPVIRGGRITIR